MTQGNENFRDIGLFIDDEFGFDLALTDDTMDLKSDLGLETAVTISLFTDRRVSESELPLGSNSRRGWWGDMVPDVENDQIGSRLWLLERSKVRNSDEVENGVYYAQVEAYAREALQWMIDDGAASELEIIASSGNGQVCIEIGITRPTGTDERFQVIWRDQFGG